MFHKQKKAYMTQQQKEQPKTTKKARIIVRNLPFKNLSEKVFEELFKEYGDIVDVNLLRKDDGKFVGCGFIEFKQVSSAAKAICHANQKEVNGRKIIVDWAVSKNKFLEKINKLDQHDLVKVKSEDMSDEEEGNLGYELDKKPDAWSSDSDENNVGDTDSEREDSEQGEDDDDDDSHDEEDGGGDDVDKKDKKIFHKNGNVDEKVKQRSSDVEEGRTVFVRNIPFSATNEDLKNCFESYGVVEYALICLDKLTEHSKGTGFVKFKDKESASQSVRDSMKIFLHENSLSVTMAVSKENLEDKKNSKKIVKDSRNLYLIREGTVIAGSKAAVGVSASDMAKRLQLEQWKNQILKDLNMFVSKTRLVIHNLPPHFDDAKLKELFVKHSNSKAIIKEAKVMYDKKKVGVGGKGVSKEVGFVSFTNHEDALVALRNINNNPDIFTPKKRPIVAFSIENRSVLNTKLKRIEKSRAKLGILDDVKSNKLSKLNRKQRRFIRRRQKLIERRKEAKKLKEGSLQTSEVLKEETNETKSRKRKNTNEEKPRKRAKISHSRPEEDEPDRSQFTGVISEPGKKLKLRSKFRLKNQANIHSQTLKNERRKRREKEKKKMTVRREPKEKKGKPKLMDDANLSKILSKHRESIKNSSVMKKWYD